MNRSTFRTIKYMNRSSFSKARNMNWVGFEILTRTPVPQLPLKLPLNRRQRILFGRIEVRQRKLKSGKPDDGFGELFHRLALNGEKLWSSEHILRQLPFPCVLKSIVTACIRVCVHGRHLRVNQS